MKKEKMWVEVAIKHIHTNTQNKTLEFSQKGIEKEQHCERLESARVCALENALRN